MGIMQLYFHRILAETDSSLCFLCMNKPAIYTCWIDKADIYDIELFKCSIWRPGLVFISDWLFDKKVHEMTGDWI